MPRKPLQQDGPAKVQRGDNKQCAMAIPREKREAAKPATGARPFKRCQAEGCMRRMPTTQVHWEHRNFKLHATDNIRWRSSTSPKHELPQSPPRAGFFSASTMTPHKGKKAFFPTAHGHGQVAAAHFAHKAAVQP